MKKVAILGSSGYIGSYLVDNFKKKYKIISHTRRSIKNKKFNQNIFKKVTGDIRKNHTIDKILATKPDILIYTISLNHFWSEKNKKVSINNNYQPLKNLLNSIVKKKLKTKIIYFSTMQVYGRKYNKQIINEGYPKNIDNVYALTHSMCEDLLIKFKKKIKSYSLRLSNSFGMPVLKNDCWWLVLNDFCRSAKIKGEIIIKSDGKPLRDFISLKDVSRVVEKLIIKEFSFPVINVCSGNTFSIKEIANKVSKNRYFKKKIPVRILKKKKNTKIKKFHYDISLLKKVGIKKFTKLDKEITRFLHQI